MTRFWKAFNAMGKALLLKIYLIAPCHWNFDIERACFAPLAFHVAHLNDAIESAMRRLNVFIKVSTENCS